MKDVIRSVAMAFTMFSAIPTPQVEWKKENMKYMLCALPLVGLVIGLGLWAWTAVVSLLKLNSFVYAAGLMGIPLLISGGIHLDGFCDTVDALSSHAPAEKKREILKDPRAGAFAVMYVAAYLIVYTAFCTQLAPTAATVIALTVHHVMGRCLGPMAGLLLPSGGKGLLSTFTDSAGRRAAAILFVTAAAAVGVMTWQQPLAGLICLVLSVCCFSFVAWMAPREFGGMSGDLSGYLTSLTELVLLMGYVVCERVIFLWF